MENVIERRGDGTRNYHCSLQIEADSQSQVEE